VRTYVTVFTFTVLYLLVPNASKLISLTLKLISLRRKLISLEPI
jgi:hypothetical protein